MEKKHKTLAILEIITGVGIIFFWIGFFTVGLAPKNPPDCYFVFEHSFPLPDIIMSIGLIIAGILLLKQKSEGVPLSLVCAGGLMFLGVLDFSFNIQKSFLLTGERSIRQILSSCRRTNSHIRILNIKLS